MKKASNYILSEEYKVYYEPINNEIQAEKRSRERNIEEQEAERNMATPEERREALFSVFKKD